MIFYGKDLGKNISKFWAKLLLVCLLLIGSTILGQGIARATNDSTQVAQVNPPSPGSGGINPAIQAAIANITTTDLIPKRYEQSLQIYLANCSTCHIALPAEILPRQTWQRLVENTNRHYEAQLPIIPGLEINLMWDYLGTFSRPNATEDRIPFRSGDSRFFRALHPGVTFPERPKVGTCLSCHPSAAEFNFRTLAN
jgi:hypothetical protein